MNAMSMWFDMIVLAVALMFSISSLSAVAYFSADTKIPEYEDKTFTSANGTIETYSNIKNGRDLMAMLIVADEYTAYPGRIRVNSTPIIKLDKNWVSHKNQNINIYYGASGAYKFSTLLDKTITKCEFVHTVVGSETIDYIQYTLE